MLKAFILFASLLLLVSSCAQNPPSRTVDPDDAIEHALRSKLDDFKYCYARVAGDKKPDDYERLVARFEIDRFGQASKFTTTSDSIQLPEFNQCISKVIETDIRFPDQDESRTVEYSFGFHGYGEQEFEVFRIVYSKTHNVFADAIDHKIRDQRDLFRACYENYINKSPKKELLSGKLVYEFIIQPSGKVSNVQNVKDTLHVTEVQVCVGEVLQKIQFDPVKEKTTIRYPFGFQNKP